MSVLGFRSRARVLLAALTAALVAIMFALPSSAQNLDPRNLLFEMIDQLQTGRSQPVLYGPDVQNTIAEQTNDTGVYLQLRQLGRITNITFDRSQPLQGGYIFYLTAFHAGGQALWQLAYSTRTQRIEAFQFNIGGAQQPPVQQPPVQQPAPPATSGKKPLAPPRTAGPTVTPPPQPPVYQPPPLPPPAAAPPIPTPPPITPTRVLTPPANQPANPPANPPAVSTPTANPNTPDMSAACRKFPNLC